jgi:Cd2+/Zn2+-exporting ATPase
MTEKISLELALVLPSIPDEQDTCIKRLITRLLEEGMEKVHVVQTDGKPRLCLHYDPTHFKLQQVRSLAQAAGAQLSHRYQHELMRIDGRGCKNFCVNGQLAGNCCTPMELLKNDRHERIDRQPAG